MATRKKKRYAITIAADGKVICTDTRTGKRAPVDRCTTVDFDAEGPTVEFNAACRIDRAAKSKLEAVITEGSTRWALPNEED